MDKDFGTLAVLHGQAHAGIIRLVNMSLRDQAAVCQHVLLSHADDLVTGAIVTAEKDRPQAMVLMLAAAKTRAGCAIWPYFCAGNVPEPVRGLL